MTVAIKRTFPSHPSTPAPSQPHLQLCISGSVKDSNLVPENPASQKNLLNLTSCTPLRPGCAFQLGKDLQALVMLLGKRHAACQRLMIPNQGVVRLPSRSLRV